MSRHSTRATHWTNNGYAHPQIYFIDHTSASWPVDKAAWVWNQAQGIDSTYEWGTCPAIAGIHCVNVNDADYGANGWSGLTTFTYSGQNITSAKIQLNDHYLSLLTHYGYLQHMTCHEEGHVLGLGHDTSTTSCIYGSLVATAVPNSYDFALVANIYNTAH